MSILHIVSVCEQQRGTKEVESVSLKSKCIFGQKQNKSALLLLPLLQYMYVSKLPPKSHSSHGLCGTHSNTTAGIILELYI